MHRVRTRVLRGAAGAALLIAPLASACTAVGVPGSVGSAPVRASQVQPVRTTWTSEFGVERPAGITYDAGAGQLLVAQRDGTATSVVRLGFDEEHKGSFTLPGVTAADTLAFDAATNDLTTVENGALVSAAGSSLRTARPTVARRSITGLAIDDPQAATIDARTRTWYVLDAPAREVVRARKRGAVIDQVTRIPLSGLAAGTVKGIAFNPQDGLLYVAVPAKQRLYGLDATGSVQKAFDLSAASIKNLTAMTFAPSADRTDAPSEQDLYIADAGNATTLGGVTEVSLAAEPLAAAAVTQQTATLVQTVLTSGWNPASPDPSGIAWLPAADRLEIVDSEVDEETGAGYHGVNMWQSTRSGTVTDTGTLFPTYSKEPTGCAYDGASNTLFVSDDSRRRIHIIKPGADNRFGTGDDVVTFIDTLALGSDDTEDPAFNSNNGHLYFSDAISTEIYDVNPVDGVFGNGNDVVTHFDVGVHGVNDGEGLAYDSVRNTLLVGDRLSRKIYEITTTGTLLRVIDAKVGNYSVLSGLTIAPGIDNPSRRDYWIVSRGTDNGADPNENDGKIIEVSAPVVTVDNPPAVTITTPAEGATVSGANVLVQADASDDIGVTKVQFFDGTTSIGTDTNGADGWSVTWNTTTVANGPHTVRATATDTANQAGTDTNNVTVDNTVDTPPTVSITSPASGAFLNGTSVELQATATDDHGVTKVQFFDGTTSIGTDTNGTNGWSVTWNTTTAADGPHTINATATDTTNKTGNDSVNVTVDNSPPSVSVTSPAPGSIVSGLTSLVATAADPQGLASVAFVLDGTTTIGTDTDGTDGWSFDWNTLGTTNGNHQVTARATNRTSLTTTSAPVAVDVENVAAPVIRNIPIANGSDDVEERLSDGQVIATSDDLDMMVDIGVDQSAVGLRFTNVTIPPGSTITNAYVQFVADETSSDPTSLVVAGIAADSAPPWSLGAFSLSTAPRTSASVAWVPPGWTEPQQSVGERTANISAVIQQVVDRPGWASSNAIAVVITGSGRRVAKSFEAEVLSAPVLHVEFTTPPVADAGGDKSVGSKATFSLDGSGSSDPNGQPLTYEWTQIEGPVAVIDDRTKVQPVVNAPKGPATLRFRLTVTNASGQTATDDVAVEVKAPK